MNIFIITGFAVVAAAVAVLLGQYRPEYGLLVGLLGGVLILGFVLVRSVPVLSYLSELLSNSGASVYAPVVIKSLGICYVAQLACDYCKDAGQTALASNVELAGKAAVLIITLPMLQNLVQIALTLITG